MTSNAPTTDGWNLGSRPATSDQPAADALLRLVDAGLCGVIFVAPYFFGGRHDIGRLLLVSIIAVTATAWFTRQALLPAARWPRTFAHVLLLLAAALVVLQIMPLPPEWIARLSPRTGQLLPLWTGAGDAAPELGAWQTLSLMPHETTKSLAMLLSYVLLFVVVIGRIEEKADAERLLRCVAISALIMAAFGLVHYATTDGRFFWFYWHPHRKANDALSGPFVNRNHFADFLVLGVGPLLAWLWASATRPRVTSAPRRPGAITKESILVWILSAATILVTLTILLSKSRGGMLALLVAGAVLVSIYLWRGIADSRFVYGLVGLAVVVVGVLSLHTFDHVTQRLDDFTEGSLDDLDRSGIRRTLWAANIAAFEAGWMTGAGAGTHLELCPVYLPRSFVKQHTHAENSYLQIASENGIGGVALLTLAVGMCGIWCVTGLRRATNSDIVRLLGAAAAGLAASLMHSMVDFVWYIPACMSVTIVLAGCALRLSQLARPPEDQETCYRAWKRGHWIERAALAFAVGLWTVHTYVGPGFAAVHWDRYLRASVADRKLAEQHIAALVDGKPATLSAERFYLNETMLDELHEVVRWDPKFARAHLRLAARYVAQFELLQEQASNAMNLAQIRDVLSTASFASPSEMQAWLERAFGSNLAWLRRAADEARVAVSLCPLQGEGYLYLAQLSFLSESGADDVALYVDQALRVRPNDADVLFELGRQDFIAGDLDSALARWSQCFNDPGAHQQKIVHLVAGRIPAAQFLEAFQPDWRALRGIWGRYRESGQQEDINSLLNYAAMCAEHDPQKTSGLPEPSIWYWRAKFYTDAGRPDDALKCLQRAYDCGPGYYSIRRALAQALHADGRYAEAEPHYRWCLARQPNDKSLNNALLKISKQRLAQRELPRKTSLQEQLRPAAVAQAPSQTTAPAGAAVTMPK